MKDTFTPPIKSRTTEELLQIVGAPAKWNQDAVSLAKYELADRNVAPVKVEMAKYLSNKSDRIEKWVQANEGYHVCDFIISPLSTLAEILFSWELKKDGFDRKARQQKIMRPILLLLVIIFIISMYI